ncbi:DUF547 domain-containing protein [Salinimonas marina]|nr:DUF547 domain-containing protein [Salinimonas marina]
MRIMLTSAIAGWLLIVSTTARADTSLHQPYETLLQQHVITTSAHSTAVDYAALAQHRSQLKAYLSALSAISKKEYAQWSQARQLAFLLNAYNAHTLALIVKHHGEIDSIKDIGGFFSSAWNQPVALLLGKKRTLDEIEHGMIRGQDKRFAGFNEPRIHFAVNCASIGCPALREEPYRADKLEQQLSEQTHRFLSDTSRNRMSGEVLQVSKIFDWYKADFTRNGQPLAGFFSRYADSMQLTDTQQALLKNNSADIEFLDYDWSLNATQ